ncbi:MAG: hypothetical protein KKH47_11605 [Proteobacteria bacterium]|nr:hypothetical protein [Pseudomonadota bacterium]
MEKETKSNIFVAFVAAGAAILAALISSGVVSYFALQSTRELTQNNLKIANLNNQNSIKTVQMSNEASLQIARQASRDSLLLLKEKISLEEKNARQKAKEKYSQQLLQDAIKIKNDISLRLIRLERIFKIQNKTLNKFTGVGFLVSTLRLELIKQAYTILPSSPSINFNVSRLPPNVLSKVMHFQDLQKILNICLTSAASDPLESTKGILGYLSSQGKLTKEIEIMCFDFMNITSLTAQQTILLLNANCICASLDALIALDGIIKGPAGQLRGLETKRKHYEKLMQNLQKNAEDMSEELFKRLSTLLNEYFKIVEKLMPTYLQERLKHK